MRSRWARTVLGLALAAGIVATAGAGATWWYWRGGAESRIIVGGATDEDRKHTVEALGVFEQAGLELPPVRITFYPAEDCPVPPPAAGFAFEGGTHHRIELCTSRVRQLVHELAHVWIYENVGESRRRAFADLRGLPTWQSPDYPWEQRAGEHAAEVLTWALLRLPDEHVLTKPDDHAGLILAFELLVGRPFRG